MTTGDGPKALFEGAVVWLPERQVLLPGMSRLERLVARTRDGATQRLWDVLASLMTPAQARQLEQLLEVPDGARTSDLERMRKGPTAVLGRAGLFGIDPGLSSDPCIICGERTVEVRRERRQGCIDEDSS